MENFSRTNSNKFSRNCALFMQGDSDSIYPDVMDSPVYMVSDKLKQLLAAYDPEVIYRRVVLNQINEGIQRSIGFF